MLKMIPVLIMISLIGCSAVPKKPTNKPAQSEPTDPCKDPNTKEDVKKALCF